MLALFKNGITSVVLRVKILDTTAAYPKGLAGLTSASSGLIISTIANNEATTTAYTAAGSTIETITTLGTYAAPTATKCRFKEVDATNHPGLYEIQIADARFAVANARSVIVSVLGATNAAQTDALIQLTNAGLEIQVDTKLWNGLATVALPLVPTVAGRTLDVSAGGEGGVDWANVGSPTTTVGLSGTTVKTATDVETDTADIQARIPAALTGGGNIKADALALSGDTVAADNAEAFFDGTGYAGTNNVIPVVTTVNGLAANSLTAAAAAADFGAEIAGAVWDEAIAGHLAAGSTGLALNSAGSAGDPWSTAVPGAYGAGTAGAKLGRVPDIAAGAAGGLFIAGSNAATTVNITGTLSTVTTLTNLPAITANWLTAAGAAADFTAEIQAGLATAASIAALNNLSAAQANAEADTAIADAALATAANLAAVAGYLDTEMAAALAAVLAVKAVTDLLPNAGALTNLDAAISTRATPAQILTTVMTEAYAADGAVPTLAQAVFEILAMLTEKSVSAVTLTTKKRDGVTTARTYTLNDAAVPTAITGS